METCWFPALVAPLFRCAVFWPSGLCRAPGVRGGRDGAFFGRPREQARKAFILLKRKLA